ncbi:MAG: hypothetical protein ACF8LL_12395, partial [Phycisphaerales bacterium]
VLISLPFKVLLFVLVDGWTLVVGSLLASFAQPDEVAAVLRESQGAIAAVLPTARDALGVLAPWGGAA